MSIIFRRPGVFFAWELVNGADPVELVGKVADSGMKWVCQEYGDAETMPTALEIKAVRDRCHALGLLYGGWSVGVNAPLLESVAPNFWVFNVETDSSDYSAALAGFRAHHPLYQLGVVTDCGLAAAPFIRANVHCLPEAYAEAPGANPMATPANMVARTHQEGWRLAFPVLGVFSGARLADYGKPPFGDGWSVYLDADMNDTDWATAAAWNGRSGHPS